VTRQIRRVVAVTAGSHPKPPASPAGRPMPDGARPGPGGWNRIHFICDDIEAEIARLRAAGVPFRNEKVTGPGGQQILVQDPAGNLIELFPPASR
jgi:catechol 2,3-dioxygenase-like lactoylglutathione lyase family enzyme